MRRLKIKGGMKNEKSEKNGCGSGETDCVEIQ
jgi:hypothetical protein